MSIQSRRTLLMIAAGAIIGPWFLFSGCALGPQIQERVLGSPGHHVNNGVKLIKKERINAAQREFELALELDPRYSSAYRGLGLIYGLKMQFNSAFEAMGKAIYYAKKEEGKTLTSREFDRLHAIKSNRERSGFIERDFFWAGRFIQDFLNAYYFMGIAYKYGYRIKDSEEGLSGVMAVNKDFMREADVHIRMVNKIEQAMPGTVTGRGAAFLDEITRADAAALLIRELRLDSLYKKTCPEKYYKSSKSLVVPPDVKDHPLSEDIIKAIRLNMEGLMPFPDGNFRPDETITRSGYAVIIAGIIASIKEDFFPDKDQEETMSGIRDVRSDASYFNAVKACVSRGGIMEVRNGLFNPMGKVSGVDALLIIKRLKKELGIREGS